MNYFVELTCPICGERFRRPASVFRAQVKKGQKVHYGGKGEQVDH